MSIIERDIHPLPQRADPDQHAMRGGRTWFSGSTIESARHFDDLPLWRLLWPAALGVILALLALYALTPLMAGLLWLGAGLGLAGAVRGLTARYRLLGHLTELKPSRKD